MRYYIPEFHILSNFVNFVCDHFTNKSHFFTSAKFKLFVLAATHLASSGKRRISNLLKYAMSYRED